MTTSDGMPFLVAELRKRRSECNPKLGDTRDVRLFRITSTRQLSYHRNLLHQRLSPLLYPEEQFRGVARSLTIQKTERNRAVPVHSTLFCKERNASPLFSIAFALLQKHRGVPSSPGVQCFPPGPTPYPRANSSVPHTWKMGEGIPTAVVFWLHPYACRSAWQIWTARPFAPRHVPDVLQIFNSDFAGVIPVASEIAQERKKRHALP